MRPRRRKPLYPQRSGLQRSGLFLGPDFVVKSKWAREGTDSTHLDATGMPAGNETYDVFVSYSRAVSTRRI